MLHAIDAGNERQAVDLLARGLAKRSSTFWETCLARLDAFGGNSAAGVPIGYLLMAGSSPVGVILTPAYIRTDAGDRPRRMINFSSWYIEPDHRWRAPLMLNTILKDREATFTDLTPTASVQKILLHFGFKAINVGERIVALPQAALCGPFRSKVVALQDAPAGQIARETQSFLIRHVEFGCLALSLHAEEQSHALLFKPCNVKGLPAVRLVYCDDHAFLARNIGAVARHLLGTGKMFLIADMISDLGLTGLSRQGHALKFVKNGDFTGRTDYAGTELCLFDL